MDQSTINPKQLTVDNKQDDRLFFSLMERAGSMGRYQTFTYLLWITTAYLIGGIVFCTPFLFYQNDYQCGQIQTKSQCYDFVCSLPTNERERYIFPGHFESMINKFGDYRCPSQLEQMNWAITGIFSGVFFGMSSLLIFGNCFGRKTLSLFNIAIGCSGMLLTIFSTQLFWAALGLFFAQFGMMTCFHMTFYFITQTVSQKYREKFTAIIQVFYGVGATLDVLWFFLIGDYQIILLCCYLIPSIIVMSFIFFYVKQTPIILVTKHDKEKVLRDFSTIARINKKSDFQLTHAEIDQIKVKYEKILNLKAGTSNKNFNFFDLFRYKSLRLLTIMLMIVVCSITFIYYAPSLLLSQFNFDIFLNGLVIQSGQMLGYILACFIVVKYNRKTIAYVCFSITFLSSFVLIFLWDQDSPQTSETAQKVFILIFVFLIQVSISAEFSSFYVHMNQIYPTQVRIIGTGLIASSSGILLTFSQKIIELLYSLNFKIMILITAMAGVSLVFSYFLPQSFGKLPPQLIQELALKQQSNQNEQSILASSINQNQTAF